MQHYNLIKEDETRYNLVDPLLKKTGWNLADCRSVGFEIPIDGYDASPINGITGYCLSPDFADVMHKAFNEFILEHHYCIYQTRFLHTVQTVLHRNADWKLATYMKLHLPIWNECG